ncbi:MAG: ABC transporter permease [Candidatus Aenigmarchaeota archaeon]|nr:ABC transporter permease [Candidatus Aenigmarchaeota archaeon]
MKILYSALIPVLIIVGWYFASFFSIINPLFLPSPDAVFIRLGEMLLSGEIIPDALATLGRMFVGFAISILVGLPIGLVMGYYRRVYYSLEFVVDFFRSIPATALFPLFLLFFGIGDEAKVAVVVFACSLIIIVNTMYGVRHSQEGRILAARTMRAGKMDMFMKVIFPGALPEIFTGLRIAASFSLVLVVVTEMFIGTSMGLGRIIIDAQLVYRIPEMYAAIVLAGVIGYLINLGVQQVERRVVHWAGK